MGRAAQEAAIQKPIFFDQDTEELLTWFEAEIKRREKDLPSQEMPATRLYAEEGDGQFVTTEE